MDILRNCTMYAISYRDKTNHLCLSFSCVFPVVHKLWILSWHCQSSCWCQIVCFLWLGGHCRNYKFMCLSAKWQISQWVHQHFCSYCPVIDNEFHHWKLRLRIPYPQLFWQCYVTHEKLIRVRNSHQAEETDKEAEGFRNSYRWWWIFRHSRRTTSISWRSRGKIFTVGLWSPYKVDHFVLFIVPSAKNFGHFVWACLLTKISTASFGSRRR